jgi:hypothetical protein
MVIGAIIFLTVVCGGVYFMIRNYNNTHIGGQIHNIINAIPMAEYEDTGIIVADWLHIEDVEFTEVQ